MLERYTTRISESVRHRLPLLLILCYAIALVFPAPGQAIRSWQLPEQWPEIARPSMSQLLVAVLLYLAALGVDIRRVPMVFRQPALLISALSAVWLAPAVVILLAWWTMPMVIDSTAASTLLVGFALVASMPVANSAAAWTQQSRGELSWALALVVLSIIVCPWMIPLALKLLGLTFSDAESQALEQLTSSFTGLEFVVWVLLPTAVGVIMRWAVGAERVARHRQAVLLTSASTLLLLNYINAASALPQMEDDFRLMWLLICVVTALVLCFVGLVVAQVLGRVFRGSGTTITALDYALTMKNTGLALALASSVLEEHAILLLPVFTMTLVQHLFAGALHRGVVQRNGPVAD
ncbi:bile acid:sodium symporter [Aeoliella sp. ICT_H6.2]|uniref:Bile acid:sodium symporter n=1 Tax=Aeoliella straminimaris TaxID=2954799 RepID=A0A9X2F716_9BACT|nr:bile acid:sodium symporter [Aeoliella straminimaris]MCO6043460.1 bile acid:sodium symporter [Aeoliella straminimaris]